MLMHYYCTLTFATYLVATEVIHDVRFFTITYVNQSRVISS